MKQINKQTKTKQKTSVFQIRELKLRINAWQGAKNVVSNFTQTFGMLMKPVLKFLSTTFSLIFFSFYNHVPTCPLTVWLE